MCRSIGQNVCETQENHNSVEKAAINLIIPVRTIDRPVFSVSIVVPLHSKNNGKFYEPTQCPQR